MRFAALLSVVSLLSTAVVACAPADEEADDSAARLTGGDGSSESSTVFLFESADTKLQPKCVGTLIAPTLAVTSRTCVKVGMTVGRAADKDGKSSKRTTVKQLRTPDGDDVAITVVELGAAIGGTPAVITHAPLRGDYTVLSWSAKDEANFLGFGADKGEASSIDARLVSEDAQFSSLAPGKDKTICAGDVGAPVCSQKSGWVRGTCGLAGVVIAPETAGNLTDAANGGCSAGNWKVATLGRHADFLKKLAPAAFQPITYTLAPTWTADGLWGYKSAGTVKTCKITTANLSDVPANGAVTIKASASFTGMQERAAAYGRFGIARKDKPTEITWWPATATQSAKDVPAFDATFEGSVTAGADGDYIVLFRASGNGGESWQVCDMAGKADTVKAEKALPVRVGTAATTPTSPDGTTVPEGTTPTKPSTATSTATTTDYSDAKSNLPETEGDPGADEESDIAQPVTKKAAAGCSAAPGASSSSFGLVGVLLGLAAIVRRRRA